MLDKKNFCLIVDAMKENYDRGNRIYNDLKKYNIYVDKENQPLDVMLEKLIKINFNKWQSDIILNYAYPIEERENISSADLYDELIGTGDKN